MYGESRAMRTVALALGLAGALALTACDERSQKSERSPGERQAAEAEAPQRAETAEPGPPAHINPGARPETGAGLIGTWRVRVVSGAGGPEGVTYTFTADGRVTVGPGQSCRYRVEKEALAIDCAGTTAESASGRIERRAADLFVWSVGEKTVHLERETGVKEQQ